VATRRRRGDGEAYGRVLRGRSSALRGGATSTVPLDCRDVRIRRTARGARVRTWARPTTPGQAPLTEGGGKRVGQRWFATGAGSSLETGL
jgi:hypothetical protein